MDTEYCFGIKVVHSHKLYCKTCDYAVKTSERLFLVKDDDGQLHPFGGFPSEEVLQSMGLPIDEEKVFQGLPALCLDCGFCSLYPANVHDRPRKRDWTNNHTCRRCHGANLYSLVQRDNLEIVLVFISLIMILLSWLFREVWFLIFAVVSIFVFEPFVRMRYIKSIPCPNCKAKRLRFERTL